MPNATLTRPDSLAKVIGQEAAVAQLADTLNACAVTGETVPHCLLIGPAGCGKTTLAKLVSNATGGGKLWERDGTSLANVKALVKWLRGIKPGDVVLIDEIHALPARVRVALLRIMEDFRMDVTQGEGDRQTIETVEMPPFTLVGATTDAGLLPPSLRDRFDFTTTLVYYSDGELARIAHGVATANGVSLTDAAAGEIGRRSMGVPRLAAARVGSVRRYAINKASEQGLDWRDLEIDADTADAALTFYGIDAIGLDLSARMVLETLCLKCAGGPTGVDTLAAMSGILKSEVRQIEVGLIRLEFIELTATGRKARRAAYRHLGLDKQWPVTILH